MPPDGPFDQLDHAIRFDWGHRGARRAVERGDVVVIVDVLRFTTAVAAAVDRGALIHPCECRDDVAALAGKVGGVIGGKGSTCSLSPGSYKAVPAGTRVILWSPNGATCARLARRTAHLFAGVLVNARATARAVNEVASGARLPVSVIGCGERWSEETEDGAQRFAVEDALGAGAILTHLAGEKSPEARWAEAAFLGLRHDLRGVLRNCGSGRELIDRGDAADVDHAASLDRHGTAAVMHDGAFSAFGWTAGCT